MKQPEKGTVVAGLKEARKAVLSGRAAVAFLAEDTDPRMKEPFRALCEEHRVELVSVFSRKELARQCRVERPTAAAALLREE